jgi:hypothetical protein
MPPCDHTGRLNPYLKFALGTAITGRVVGWNRRRGDCPLPLPPGVSEFKRVLENWSEHGLSRKSSRRVEGALGLVALGRGGTLRKGTLVTRKIFNQDARERESRKFRDDDIPAGATYENHG